MGSTNGRPGSSGLQRSQLIDDDRNFLQKGIDRMFYAPGEEPYTNQRRPVANGIKQHQKEQHDYRTREAHLKSLRGTAASKTSQTSREVRDHLEAASGSGRMPLGWLFNAPSIIPEYEIGTPGGSAASSHKETSLASSKKDQGVSMYPVVRDLLTTDNLMRRYMLAANNNMRL